MVMENLGEQAQQMAKISPLGIFSLRRGKFAKVTEIFTSMARLPKQNETRFSGLVVWTMILSATGYFSWCFVPLGIAALAPMR